MTWMLVAVFLLFFYFQGLAVFLVIWLAGRSRQHLPGWRKYIWVPWLLLPVIINGLILAFDFNDGVAIFPMFAIYLTLFTAIVGAISVGLCEKRE